MMFDLLGKDDTHSNEWYRSAQLILALKKQFLADGGDPVDFPEYLKEAGVKAVGQFIAVDDSFVTMAKLKYEK